MTILYKTTSLFPPASRESDASLLDAAKQMDRDALVQIFDTYSSAIYNYAFRLCSDPLMADNIVGDVFAKLLEHLSVGRGPSTNLRSYLYEMTYHMVVDEARYAQRTAQMESVDLQLHDEYSAHISVEDRILFKAIIKAIQNLKADQRHVIILRFLEGFSVHETAVIIGKEESNIKVIQNRAIGALRKALGHEGVT